MILENAVGRHMDEVKALYEAAFPENERKPLDILEKNCGRGITDILAVTDGGDFKGLVITVNSGDMVMVDYFAVSESQRGQGTGSQVLKLMEEKYAGKRIFLEIELPGTEYENHIQREKRKAFYLRNGLKESGIHVRVYGTDMELLVFDGPVTFEEYKDIYALAMGERVKVFGLPEEI